MTKRFLTLFFAALMICGALSGCQLALTDGIVEPTKDKLIGFYIVDQETNSRLGDKFDAEGRIYAVKTIDQNIPENVDYKFEGVEGVAFFTATFSDAGGKGIFNKPFNGPEIFNTLLNVGNNENTISGEISVAANAAGGESNEVVLFFFNVYQTADDEIYMINKRSGVAFSPSNSCEFAVSESYKMIENNSELETKTTVRVKMTDSKNVQKYVFNQMDKQNNSLETITVTTGNRPDSIIRDKNAEYIIVEIYGLSSDNKETVTRELINSDESIYFCRFPGERRIDVVYPLEIK